MSDSPPCTCDKSQLTKVEKLRTVLRSVLTGNMGRDSRAKACPFCIALTEEQLDRAERLYSGLFSEPTTHDVIDDTRYSGYITDVDTDSGNESRYSGCSYSGQDEDETAGEYEHKEEGHDSGYSVYSNSGKDDDETAGEDNEEDGNLRYSGCSGDHDDNQTAGEDVDPRYSGCSSGQDGNETPGEEVEEASDPRSSGYTCGHDSSKTAEDVGEEAKDDKKEEEDDDVSPDELRIRGELSRYIWGNQDRAPTEAEEILVCRVYSMLKLEGSPALFFLRWKDVEGVPEFIRGGLDEIIAVQVRGGLASST